MFSMIAASSFLPAEDPYGLHMHQNLENADTSSTADTNTLQLGMIAVALDLMLTVLSEYVLRGTTSSR